MNDIAWFLSVWWTCVIDCWELYCNTMCAHTRHISCVCPPVAIVTVQFITTIPTILYCAIWNWSWKPSLHGVIHSWWASLYSTYSHLYTSNWKLQTSYSLHAPTIHHWIQGPTHVMHTHKYHMHILGLCVLCGGNTQINAHWICTQLSWQLHA